MTFKMMCDSFVAKIEMYMFIAANVFAAKLQGGVLSFGNDSLCSADINFMGHAVPPYILRHFNPFYLSN